MADTSPDSELIAECESWCKKQWEDHKNAYYVYHLQVLQSILMYAGLLWIEAAPERSSLLQIGGPEDEWTPTPNVNYYSPQIDSITSSFQMPEVEAVPQEDDNEDSHDIAVVSNAVKDWIFLQNGITKDFKGQEDKLGLARQLFVLAGTVFTIVEKQEQNMIEAPVKEAIPAMGMQCPECDTYKKVPMSEMPPPPPSSMLMGQDVQGPQGMPCPTCQGPLTINETTMQSQKIDEATGEPMTQQQTEWSVDIKIGNSLYALPRPGSKSMKDSGWTMWAERMVVDDVKAEYDFDASPDGIFLDGASLTSESNLTYWLAGYADTAKSSQDSCMVVKYYVEPGRVKDFPQGLLAIMCNERIIQAKQWLPELDDHPLTKGDYLKLPLVYFGRTTAFDMMDIQREINSYESIIKLNAMTCAAEPIVIDQNMKVTEITGRGDVVIWVKSLGPGGMAPYRLKNGNLNQGVYEQRQSLADRMQQISGAVGVFRGEQPGSVTAASGIAQLRGQAEQGFSVPMGNWSGMWCETARKATKVAQKCMTSAQIAELMGPDHDVQIAKFQAADLDDALLWVSTSHGLPRTRDEKRQEMMQLFDSGALDLQNPDVKEKIFELFGETGMMSQFNLDATRARKENKDMKTTGIPAICRGPLLEDLQTHLAIHVEAIKALDFDQLPPPAQTAMIQHALATQQAMMPPPMPALPPGAPGPPKPPGQAMPQPMTRPPGPVAVMPPNMGQGAGR